MYQDNISSMHRSLYVADSNRVGELAQLTLSMGLGEPECGVSWVNTSFI